jgi:ferredoxin
MNFHGCAGGLMPGNASGDANGVSYYSRGALLVACDGPFDPAPLYQVELPRPPLVVSPVRLAFAPGRNRIRYVQGRVSGLRGWLGAFRPDFQELAPGSPERPGANRDGTFDLVIDLSARPLIDLSVAPFGYFAPRDHEQFASAVAQAAKLVGDYRKPKYFDYERGLCAHASFGQAGCTRCLDVCGADAIRSEGDRIAVNPHLCQGCAACTLACPTGALSFTALPRAALLGEVDRLLAGAGASSPTLVVHAPGEAPCPPAGADWVSLAVSPVVAFGEELWLAALARGAGQVLLQVGVAVPAETAALLEARVALAGMLLRACGHDADSVRIVRPGESAAVSDGKAAIRHRREAPAGETTLPTHHKRALLTRSLARLEADEGFAPATLPAGAPLGTIEVNTTRCTLCSACAHICPTAAIRYADDAEAGLARLAFAEELCVQCGACANGCPEQAIELKPRVAPLHTRGYWRILSEEPLARCIDCERPFLAEKLLAANLRRIGPKTTVAAVEQLKCCPDCRHRRINEG